MAAPLIAIAGSVEPNRVYDPPVKNKDQAEKAAEDLGRELAKAGCRLLVYSSDRQFIEPAFVRGYAASEQAKPKSIMVRYPADYVPSFPEQQTKDNLFDPYPETHPNWEVSFYRSLRDVDGIILLGGGRSVLVTGLIALAYRIPLVALATFGGAAQSVWNSISPDKDLIATEERNLMGRADWKDNSAAALVQNLKAQRGRLAKEARETNAARKLAEKKTRDRALLEGLFLIGAVGLTALGLFSYHTFIFAVAFFGTPVLAGGAGALVRILLDLISDTSSRSNHAVLPVVALGMTAGAITAVLFALSQLTTNPAAKNFGASLADPSSGVHLLTLFELVVGFIAGLTMDVVFTKLKGIDVVKPDVLKGNRA